MKKYYIPVLLALAILFQSCGVSYVRVPVTRPAEVNMTKFKKVTIGEFTGHKGGYEVFSALTSALVASGKFEVLDRQNLDRILLENELAISGITEGEGATRLQNLIGAAALVSGHVSSFDFTDKVERGEPYKDKDGKSHVSFTRSALATVNVTFRITDLTSGRIIFSRPLEQRKEMKTSAVDKDPDFIDKKKLLSIATGMVIDEFLSLIMPHTVFVSVELLDDSDLPDMEKGISFAKAGSWNMAIDVFHGLTSVSMDNEKLSKVYYNLGISYQYNYEFAEARQAFNKALSLHNDDRYVNAINNCRLMEYEQEKVRQQLNEAND
jgi:curli biogenesis system outer membrane secretion channel CsgG